MTDPNTSREQGVEFGAFEDTMESLDYPVDHADLLERYGDTELELPDGTATLGAVLEPLQDEDRTYHDEDELETMILNMIGDDAVGREGYSDRGVSNESNRDDQQSL